MAVLVLGYSMPLAAVLAGVSYGKWTLRRSRLGPWVRRTAGGAMAILGVYFLI